MFIPLLTTRNRKYTKPMPAVRPREQVQLVVTLASGKADALSGCFLRVHDDLDALLVHADTIQSEERLRLRLSQ